MEDRCLFRGKRTDNGEWVQGCLITDETEDSKRFIGYVIGTDEDGIPHDLDVVQVEPSTICQCTGLKDKNCKLIWENDIVDFLGHKGTVVFECGSFGIAYKTPIDWNGIEANIKPITGCDNRLYVCENDNYISLWEIYWNFNDEDDSLNTVEVIGNIFDNPELLESEE